MSVTGSPETSEPHRPMKVRFGSAAGVPMTRRRYPPLGGHDPPKSGRRARWPGGNSNRDTAPEARLVARFLQIGHERRSPGADAVGVGARVPGLAEDISGGVFEMDGAEFLKWP